MQDISTFISNHPLLFAAAAFIIFCLVIVEFLRAKTTRFNINPTETTQLINHQNAVIIDIRSRDAFEQGHIIDALSMPASDVNDKNNKIMKFKGKPIIIVCNVGMESQKVAALLLKSGYNAYSLAGGMRAWLNAQLPVIKGSS